MMAPVGSRRLGLLLIAVIFAADQLSKLVMVELLLDRPWPQQILVLPPWFNLTVVWNRGVSFGLLAADSQEAAWLLSALAIAVSIGLGLWLRRADTRLTALALGAIIGGALGNVVDRLRWGAVFDFFDFSGLWFPYVFNVADAAISIGVAALVLDGLIGHKAAKRDVSS